MVAGREGLPAAVLVAGGKVVCGRSAESDFTCEIDEFRGLLGSEEAGRFLVSADLAARLGDAFEGRLSIDSNGARTIAGRLGDR
jgi:hypothetical protein